jgi:hypothetical protein
MSLFLAFFAPTLAAEMGFLGLVFEGETSGCVDGVFLMVKLWWTQWLLWTEDTGFPGT